LTAWAHPVGAGSKGVELGPGMLNVVTARVGVPRPIAASPRSLAIRGVPVHVHNAHEAFHIVRAK
jgi:hypothetical protein